MIHCTNCDILSQALKNLRKFPLPLQTGEQATIVEGIGPTIAKRLTQELAKRGLRMSHTLHAPSFECHLLICKDDHASNL